jgi:hypothetical protein
LDAKLNLPEDSYSYLLQEWGISLGVHGAWEKVTQTLKSMLGIELWNSCLERIAERTGQDVADFYEQHSRIEVEGEAKLLVATVDCKGVPIRKNEPVQKRVRLKKGEKPGKKKMTTVTGLYTIECHHRQVEDIVKDSTIRNKLEQEKPLSDRPKPKNKIVKATFKGKKAAFEDLAQQVLDRNPGKKKECVALVDGERKLRQLLAQYLPNFCIILDLYHVLEYLWVAAHLFYREGSEQASSWVQSMLRLLLEGKVEDLILYLKGGLMYQELSSSMKASLRKIIGYFDRGKLYMKYDVYISRGYPIGSGVIEGACKNLVKDRMELSGMRWTISGAETMLGLRSISVNQLEKAFWNYRTNSQREHLYGRFANASELNRCAA